MLNSIVTLQKFTEYHFTKPTDKTFAIHPCPGQPHPTRQGPGVTNDSYQLPKRPNARTCFIIFKYNHLTLLLEGTSARCAVPWLASSVSDAGSHPPHLHRSSLPKFFQVLKKVLTPDLKDDSANNPYFSAMLLQYTHKREINSQSPKLSLKLSEMM